MGCRHCGSDKIIPSVPLLDHYGDAGTFSRPAEVRVHGRPEAWVFKETAAAKLLADVCGECGHVELRAGNFRELYAKHVQAQRPI